MNRIRKDAVPAFQTIIDGWKSDKTKDISGSAISKGRFIVTKLTHTKTGTFFTIESRGNNQAYHRIRKIEVQLPDDFGKIFRLIADEAEIGWNPIPKATFRRSRLSDLLGLTDNDKETFEMEISRWNNIKNECTRRGIIAIGDYDGDSVPDHIMRRHILL